jgi:zinc transporter ZupT
MDPPRREEGRMRAIQILWSIAVVVIAVMLGGIGGVMVSDQVSSCNGYECFGPAYMGFFFGAIAGFVVGIVIVTASATRRHHRVDSV